MYLKSRHFLLFIVPAIISLALISLLPFIQLLITSTRIWDFTKPHLGRPFVGFENYWEILKDSQFHHSLRISYLFLLGSLFIELVLGFLIAMLFHRKELNKSRDIITTLFLAPAIVAPVVVGLAWRFLLDHTTGFVNYVLSVLSLPVPAWLGNPSTALLSIVMADVWEWTPFVSLIFLAGLLSLPRDPYEAAMIEGASHWALLRYITLPLLKPVALVILLIRTMDLLRWFDTIYIMTRGGPGMGTYTMTMHIYEISFSYFQMGKGAAFSILLLIQIIIMCLLYINLASKKEIL